MADLSVDEAHAALMSANPWAQYSGSVGLRNFAAAARATAEYLRTHGSATFVESGSAGVMTQEQAELHAQWFEKVAGTASSTADQLDTLVTAGYQHQTDAATYYAHYQDAVALDSGPNPSGADDMYLIHTSQNTQRLLNEAVDGWSSSYSSFTPADPPPPPAAGTGTGTGTGSSSAGAAVYGGAGRPTGATTSRPTEHAVVVTAPPAVRSVGDGGSIEVGSSGGEFSGWFKDPRTGYYVDPSTGREFDPVTSRWVDPVTGLPFGDVTKYATGLQGLGGPATTGGLLSETAGGAAAGVAGAGNLAGLFTGTAPTAVAGLYGGLLPPSLVSGSAATASLWQQASRSLAVKQEVAATMLAREQAARAGRSYLPPMQAGTGGSAAGSGRGRPGYLTADEEEAELFSSPGRRAYLPPTQAGGKDDKKKRAEKRPGWLVDDDVFGATRAPRGVLGDD